MAEIWNTYDDLIDGWTAAGDLTDGWTQTEMPYTRGIIGDDDFFITGDDGEYIIED